MALGPELAAEMAAVRVMDAAQVDAEIIVSGCSACKENMRKGEDHFQERTAED